MKIPCQDTLREESERGSSALLLILLPGFSHTETLIDRVEAQAAADCFSEPPP